MGLRTLLAALQSSDRVSPDSIGGPFQMNAGDEVPVVCFQFRMSHFTCKAYLAHGTQDEGGSQHLKLQTVFDDNRRSLGEEQRYFVANEWNATKRYTRLKCGAGGSGRNSSFTLEYDVLCPSEMPHSWGLLLLSQTLRMWYTSMVACVMHIVEPRDMPFATHDMIMANTLAMTVRDEDTGLQREACPICFDTFKTGEKVRRLPCMHLFHVVCEETDSDQGRHCNIDRHLTRDKTCPVCKTPIDIMERVDKNPAKGGEPSSGASGSGAVEAVGADGPPAAAAADGEAAPAAPRQSAATAEAPEVAGLPTTSAVRALATAAQAVAAAAAAADQAATIASSNGAMAAIAAAGARRTGTADGGADAAESGAALADGEGGDRPSRTDAAEQDGQLQQPSDTRALGAAAAAGLPAQAVELERAVRSLQSRWLQIQDVVAGMQQMLQYIEESQSALSLARQAADGNGSGQGAGGGQASAAAATAAAAANAASAAAAAVATAAAGVVAPAPGGGEAVAEAAADAAGADVGQGGEAPRAEAAEQDPSHGGRQPSPPEDQQGGDSAAEAAVAGREHAAGGELEGEADSSARPAGQRGAAAAADGDDRRRAEEVASSEGAEPRASAGGSAPAAQQAPAPAAPAAPAPAPAEAVAAAAPAQTARPAAERQSLARAQAAAEPVAPLASPPMVQRPRERWVPFTESEKVCMAYMWRQRRAAMLAGALAGAMAPERQ